MTELSRTIAFGVDLTMLSLSGTARGPHFDNPTFSCRQLTAGNDVGAAAAGLITLEPTTEVYRCAVIGPT